MGASYRTQCRNLSLSCMQGSYYVQEQLAENQNKLNALSEFVRRGSALVLLDGFQSNHTENMFMPLLSALLGSDPQCSATSVGSSMLLRKRTIERPFVVLDSTIEVSNLWVRRRSDALIEYKDLSHALCWEKSKIVLRFAHAFLNFMCVHISTGIYRECLQKSTASASKYQNPLQTTEF